MNEKKYRYALILISIVILTTLGIQVYWNFKNYEEARRQLIADVQISLDQSVDEYFTQRAKNETFGIFSPDGLSDAELDSLTRRLDRGKKQNGFFDLKKIESSDLTSVTIVPGATMDSLTKLEKQAGIKGLGRFNITDSYLTNAKKSAADSAYFSQDLMGMDSLISASNNSTFPNYADFFRKEPLSSTEIDTVFYRKTPLKYTFKRRDSLTGLRYSRQTLIYNPKPQYADSLQTIKIENPAIRVDTMSIASGTRFKFPKPGEKMELLVATQEDSAAITQRRDRFNESLKSLTTKMIISYSNDEIDTSVLHDLVKKSMRNKGINISFILGATDSFAGMTAMENNDNFRAVAQNPLIKNGQQIFVEYSNITSQVLKQNMTGILLSLLLISCVVFCLFYLLQVIKRQKQLGEMKNDLISNITHEFKTPIATTAAALEGVQSFTASGDTVKTDRYLNMGQEQLRKLNGMVEKLLETATLDSNELELQMSKVEINQMITTLVARAHTQTEKQIKFTTSTAVVTFMGDAFHLENALNNLIDNAIKYGGNRIEIRLENSEKSIQMEVIDSGTNLSQRDARMIFDKFYRVGSGDRHNIKGFGIGLFYTKSIIEKHGGTIEVSTMPSTRFIITLPHGK